MIKAFPFDPLPPVARSIAISPINAVSPKELFLDKEIFEVRDADLDNLPEHAEVRGMAEASSYDIPCRYTFGEMAMVHLRIDGPIEYEELEGRMLQAKRFFALKQVENMLETSFRRGNPLLLNMGPGPSLNFFPVQVSKDGFRIVQAQFCRSKWHIFLRQFRDTWRFDTHSGYRVCFQV